MSFEPLCRGPYKLTAEFPSISDPKYEGGIEYVRERQWENKSACLWRKSQFLGYLISTDIGPFLPHFIHFFNWRGLFYQDKNTRRWSSLRAIFKASYHKWWVSWLALTRESRLCSSLSNSVFSEATFMAWNQSLWGYADQQSWQIWQIGTFHCQIIGY